MLLDGTPFAAPSVCNTLLGLSYFCQGKKRI